MPHQKPATTPDQIPARQRRRLAPTLLAAIVGVLVALPALPQQAAQAVIVFREPGRNLAPPTGEFARSGWQFEGDWHRFPGTVIGPHHFLAAAHTGGFPLQPFRFRDKDYYALERTPLPGTDLALWRVAGTFPEWATLYDGNAEQKQGIVIFGRGGSRGQPVMTHGKQHGWWWNATDGQLSWGRNRVEAVQPGVADGRDRRYGSILTFRFDPKTSGAGLDTASVSGGDSGGGVFLRDRRDGQWKLAGVVYGVDRSYALPTDNKDEDGLAAALYDARGLYRVLSSGRYFIDPDNKETYSSTCLVSRVSPSVPFLRSAMRRSPHWSWYATVAAFGVGLPVLAAFGVTALVRRAAAARLRAQRQNADPSGVAAGKISDADTLP